MFKNTLQARKSSLQNQRPIQVKIEPGLEESIAPKYSRQSTKALKARHEGQENKENLGWQPDIASKKKGWQMQAPVSVHTAFGTKPTLRNYRTPPTAELVCKQEDGQRPKDVLHEDETGVRHSRASGNCRHTQTAKAGRPSRSPRDALFNISDSQIEHFLQCARERWLTGNEYANLLIHSETLGPILGIETVPGVQHPPSIYFTPRNGTLYFLKGVSDVKKLGFPPILQDRQTGGYLKRVNTKYICWKRMNFVTQIPKCSPKVEYVVASGRSSKLKISSASSLGSSSETDTFYRMHIVWLYNSERTSLPAQTSREAGPVTVLCHILQINTENNFMTKLEEEDNRFEQTPVRPTSNKNLESVHAMTASNIKSPNPRVTFTPLCKRKPLCQKPQLRDPSTNCKLANSDQVQVKVEERREVPTVEKTEAKQDGHGGSPMIFKWKSTCKVSTQAACSARLSALFGVHWSNATKDQEAIENGSRLAQEDCRHVRRVLFEPQTDRVDSFHRFDGFNPIESVQNAARSQETSGIKGISTVDHRIYGGFRLPESEYKQMLRLDDRDAPLEAAQTSNCQNWSPLLKFPNQDNIDRNGFDESRLGSYSRDCNQLPANQAIATMWSDAFHDKTPEALMGYSGSKKGSQAAEKADLQTPNRPMQPASYSDTWRSQTHQRPSAYGQNLHEQTPTQYTPPLAGCTIPTTPVQPRSWQQQVGGHAPTPRPAAVQQELTGLLHTHPSQESWQADPRVMLLLAVCPLFVLRLDGLLLNSDAAPTREIHGGRHTETWTHSDWKRPLLERLQEEAFVRFVKGLDAQQTRHTVLPAHLLPRQPVEERRHAEVKIEEDEHQTQALNRYAMLGTSGGMSRASEGVPEQKALEPTSTSKEPSRESRYSQWVRVMYAQKMLGLTNAKSAKKRE